MSTGNPMYPQTEGERLLGWKPVNFQYEPFDPRRYRRTAAAKTQRHHEWVVYADPMPHQIPGNPEATPECDADKTGISHYVVASGKGIGFDHSGAIMVSWAERGVDPFEHQTCAVSP